MPISPRPLRRLVVAGALAAVVVAPVVGIPSHAEPRPHARGGSDGGHADAGTADDGHGHDHGDPATKNAISRAGETSKDTQDPTTAPERAANAAYVARNRAATPEPELTTAPATWNPPARPGTRYALAGGCYGLAGEPIRFQATRLGWYLLYTADRRFVGKDGTADNPSADTDWRAFHDGDRFTFRLKDGSWLVARDGELSSGAEPTRFRLSRTDGCRRYPESRIGITGGPFAGTTSFQEVRGYADAHTHGMAFEFLGGAHCGRPWHRYGAPYALVDCDDHQATGTNALEAFLSGEPTHDPVGWPTFKDWPAPESLTHEGTYYKWMERSWRGGQRLFVNLLVENNQLCKVYPFKRDVPEDVLCDEMKSVQRQARDMYAFQDYIDAQWGGPGRGWYRIVKNPWQARKVINAGKMAIIMGIETSVPFGCTYKAIAEDNEVPECSKDTIDQQLGMVHKWGVRQMELVNKFDNALSGVAGDAGETGLVVNNANKLETNEYWDMQHCEPEHPDAHDKNQHAPPEIDPSTQDALFAAIGAIGGLNTFAPVYDRPDHCNSRGLTPLGAHLVDRLAQRGMLIDPDHMSVAARNSLLDQVEARDYSGILSSHSWSTEDAYPRIYEMGGFIAPYAGDSTGFVEKWRKHLGWADERFYFGLGFGADINGLGAQGDPRGADVPNPVTYPYRGLGGVTVRKQRAGKRVYDINRDGVAQYGLYPDWIEDLRKVAGSAQAGDGAAIVSDMARGAEAYLQTWERAQGIAPDSCRNPELRKRWGRVQERVREGMTTRQVMRAVGQPYTRVGNRFTFCARAGDDPNVRVSVQFSDRGRVLSVDRVG